MNENYTLANGVKIPKLGLGTWMIDNDKVVEVVKQAIDLGYRHIDTAQAYQNEEGVGRGVRESGIAREELFLTTKLAAEIKTYEEAKQAVDESLQKMGTDYIDLMLIHSPQPWMEFGEEDRFFEGNVEAWRALEDAYETGKLRAIGVSNFIETDLENLFEHGTIQPMVNQVLAHISNTPFELIQYAQDKGILVEAYSPIAHGVVLDNEELIEMAKRYDVSVAQLCIRYDLQLGLLPLPKTQTYEHLQSNQKLDFTISDEDMETLKHVEKIKDYGEARVMPVFGGKLK
ncbi:aldo/keto reductase [Exiguobacterium sp. s189]|uniref:aldo/keto reductase n=1 Tax=Exiguobacterium sp. s189 TaxID=2751263 RepID=UPI001BEC4C76|nr:aldo/keto reductase [Exiguobacterium sp. s189]